MSLEVERHDGCLWLMHYPSPGSYCAERLARFDSKEAAEIYKRAFGKAMEFAREAGRSGI